MSVRCLKNMEMPILLMPAWIAGMRFAGCLGDIHVNLDSSTPCWNDAMEGLLLKVTEAPPASIPKENSKHPKFRPPQSL
jgi:hypothetical protein